VRPARLIPVLLALPLVAPASASAADAAVTVGDNFFRPTVTRVLPGDTVTWTWAADSLESHTVTASPGQTIRFESGFKDGAGATFRRTFTERGRFRYFCRVHPIEMKGTVEVGPPPFPDTTLPRIGSLRAGPARARRSTRLRFRLSEAAKVKVVVTRSGRTARSFTRSRGKGRRSIRLSVRRLRRGRYRATLRPTDRAGNRGRAVSTTFRVIHR
jgi:plastocyanin